MRPILPLLLFPAWLQPATTPRPLRTENVILITLDGLRWQELFNGVDAGLAGSGRAGQRSAAPSYGPHRQQLFPFLWATVGTQGQLYGNRAYGNAVSVSNHQYFSYAGYQEVLAGFPDPRIRNNAPVNNPHPSVLATINAAPAYRGQVAAFGSWAVLANILNEPCCGFPVNAGWQPAAGPDLTARERELNQTLAHAPRPFAQERTDSLTFGYALEYLRRRQPRVLYLGLGDTDEQAHAGTYAAYLQAAHTADHCLADLWTYLQATPQYRGKTTLLITTDHGRGRGPWWREQRGRGRLSASQVAQTMARLLGVAYAGEQPTGPAIASVLASE